MINPDIFTKEPFEDYQAKQSEYISSHALADFAKDPSVYYGRQIGAIPPRESGAFEFGKAAHVLICEGYTAFYERYSVGGSPINPSTGKPYGRDTAKFREWLAASDPSKIYIGEEEFDALEKMCRSVTSNSALNHYFYDGIPEAVCRATLNVLCCGVIHDIKCQCRIDYWHKETETIVDLKTTRSLDTFVQDCWNYGYLYQMAFYQMVVAKRAGVRCIDGVYIRPAVVLVAVEKEQPFRSGLFKFEIYNNPLFKFQFQIRNDLHKYSHCLADNVYPAKYEEEFTLITTETKP